jgi:hypothetical protein
LRATTARSTAGGAGPLGQPAEQLLLILAGPRHVAVRPQQHGGHIEFLADVDDVVGPTAQPSTEGRPVWSSSSPRPPCISS